MSRVDIFKMVRTISQESVSHPNVDEVKVDAVKDIPKNATNDPKSLVTDEQVDAEVSNTKTTEPGPANGGGDGTAKTVDASKATTNMDVGDVNDNLNRDQNGGRHIDTLPNQVKAKDGLSGSDIRTSVEEHQEEAGGDNAETTGLKTMDASGAEEIERADDMVMDLDGEELQVTGMTDATEAKLAECDSAAAKAEALSKATATVERYHGLMKQMHREGRYMSNELRQAVSWALEDIDAQMFFTERAALESFNPQSRVSLEASDVSTQAEGMRGTIEDGADPGEVGKGLGSKLKKMFEAGIKMFWRFVNMVSDLIQSFVGDSKKIQQHLADLRKRVSILDGGTEFNMKGASRLVIQGEFVGDSKNAIAHVHKVADELLHAWPVQLVKLMQDWQAGRGFGAAMAGKTMGTAAIADRLNDILDRSFRSFQDLNSKDKGKVPSGYLNAQDLRWSQPLPGDMALYYGVTKANKGHHTTNAATDATEAVNITFSQIPGGDSHAGDVTATTPSSGEAVAVIRELEKLCQFITDSRSNISQLKQFGEDVKGEGLTDIFMGGNGAGEEGVIGGIIMMGLAKTSTESQHRFIGYLINLIKGYIGFIEASLKAEAGGREDIQGN